MPTHCESIADSTHYENIMLGDGKELEFKEAGRYVYYITEQRGELSGITYDTTKYMVVVDVRDEGGNSGKLTGSVQYYKALENGEYEEVDNIAIFTNTYAAKSVTLNGKENLSVTKKLVGREWGKEETFAFTIAAAGDNAKNTPLPDSTTLTLAKPDPDGDTATGNFGDITYEKPGTYKYEITEVEGSNVISQWDKSIYTVIVKVEDNGTGKLNIAYSSVTKNNGDVDNGIYFENAYETSPNPVKTVKDASNNSIDNTLVSPGQLLTYTIEWANTEIGPNGEPASAEITITDTVPANTSLESIDNGGTEDENHKITWKIQAEPTRVAP